MQRLTLLVGSLALLMQASASGAIVDTPIHWPAEVVVGNNQFAFDLYAQLAKENSSAVFSPYSISMALGMAYSGARGDTATEMARTLHFSIPADRLGADFGSVRKQLIAPRKNHVHFRIANRLWGTKGYRFLDSFLKIARDDYGTDLVQLDFAHQPKQARSAINSWISTETTGKIRNLVSPEALGSKTQLLLTSTIYFKGDWIQRFDRRNTQKLPFHPTAETSANVDMMYQSDHFRFADVGNASLLEMLYKGDQFSMVLILPKRADDLRAVEESLTANKFDGWLTGLSMQEVHVWLPKFLATGEVQLADALSALGMPRAFAFGRADFSGMDGKHDTFISNVVHGAFVNVDETGTEAAAATIISGAGAILPSPAEFKADHPFIYLIRDTQSGAILFMGRYFGPQ